MSDASTWPLETRRQLVHLLIEAFESDIQRREAELLEVVTRPAPAILTPRIIDEEPNLRMAISNLKENIRTLRETEVHVPDAHPSRVEIFSVVRTRQGERDTWYFITPCAYYFERKIQLVEIRLLACHRGHFLLGVHRDDTYSSGGSWNTHTGEVYEQPLTHRVVEIF